MPAARNTLCLWYDKDAEEAADFYARTFPDSNLIAVHRAPTNFPGGRAGQVLTVEFTVVGIPCAYSTPSRTPFRPDGGQHSAVMADSVPR